MSQEDRLPGEIYDLISAQCSPSTLATLARVNQEFSIRSTKLLFSRLDIFTASRSVYVLDILAASPDKAQLVKRLSIEFDHQTGSKELIMQDGEMLGNVLLTAPNLKDLRIRVNEGYDELVESLMQHIIDGPFLLDILFLPEYCLDKSLFTTLMKKESKLKEFITVSFNGPCTLFPSHVPLMLSLPRPSHLRTFSLRRVTIYSCLNTLIVYPGYESQIHAQRFGDTLDSLLHEDPGRATTNRLIDVDVISLFVHDFTESSNLSPVLQSLAAKCPSVTDIFMVFVSDSNLWSNRTTQALAYFPRLQKVYMHKLLDRFLTHVTSSRDEAPAGGTLYDYGWRVPVENGGLADHWAKELRSHCKDLQSVRCGPWRGSPTSRRSGEWDWARDR